MAELRRLAVIPGDGIGDRPRDDMRSKRYHRERDRRREMKPPSAGIKAPHSAISEKEAA